MFLHSSSVFVYTFVKFVLHLDSILHFRIFKFGFVSNLYIYISVFVIYSRFNRKLSLTVKDSIQTNATHVIHVIPKLVAR